MFILIIFYLVLPLKATRDLDKRVKLLNSESSLILPILWLSTVSSGNSVALLSLTQLCQ